MTKDMIIRAWKDPSFRASLTEEQRASLPANPAGASAVELNETELQIVVGGVAVVDAGGSSGWICTYSTECRPICL
ncbi:mersacidin/lichenicidin family type 2 lantibiotic [Myxococcaceae bacterium GXIMD 01537]